ncbi:MAG: hypothetical protein HY548_02130, partial [Elusimicrobia bacterium]|nr:hypothetical protein [Elusimicrobiota bacterium]
MSRTRRLLAMLTTRARNFISRPLPHTPSLEKYLPTTILIKRTLSLTMAIVVFYSQAVCAGAGTVPQISLNLGWFQKSQTLVERLNRWTEGGKNTLSYIFHGSQREDMDKIMGPGATPETLQKQQDRQKARMDIQQQNQLNKGLQLPAIQKQPGQQGPEQTLKDIKLLEEALPGDQITEAIQKEIQQMRAKMKSLAAEGVEFKYQPARNFDGSLKVTFFKGGQASRIENDKRQNAHGQTIVTNTRDMTYDDGDLLTSMTVETIDPKGEKTVTTRSFEYEEGAKFYKPETQKVEKLKEETVTATGEKKTMEREGMEYDKKGNVTEFKETTKEENGKETVRWWWGAEYDDNKNISSYKELSRTNGVDTFT